MDSSNHSRYGIQSGIFQSETEIYGYFKYFPDDLLKFGRKMLKYRYSRFLL